MYRIVIQELGVEPRQILAENLVELTTIIGKAEEAEYDIIGVEKTEIIYGEEFIEEVNQKLKPEDLEFGKEEKNDS